MPSALRRQVGQLLIAGFDGQSPPIELNRPLSVDENDAVKLNGKDIAVDQLEEAVRNLSAEQRSSLALRADKNVLIVAHGTELNDNSAVAAKREAERIRARGEFATVANAYMEEPPLIAEWDQLTSTPNVIVVPFFIADGLHSYEDIPKLLGIECTGMDVFRKNPHRVRGRSLYYGKAIGTDPRFADVIIEQTLNARNVSHAG
jgi:hypothetical protein